VRHLGQFLAKGISRPFRVFEVLGTETAWPTVPEWVSRFEKAVSALELREWDTAKTLFTQVISDRGGQDGPSSFFLELIPRLREDESRGIAWDGVMRLRG